MVLANGSLSSQSGGEGEIRKNILQADLVEGIVALPSQLKKRKVLLDLLIEDFEPGRSYTEQEVNFKILDHYDDYCTVRRELVDFGLLIREKGRYVRPKEE